MHLLSLPRHRIEATFSDYARILQSLLRRREEPDTFTRFERAFCDYVDCRHAVAVSSGRLGLHVLLKQLNLAPGSEVIVPAFNLFAVVEQFRGAGLVPRFCDVRRDDLNIDVEAAARLVTPKTRVLLVTHMFGHPADMRPLLDLARRHNLIVVEDCAHALGSQYHGRMVGTFGTAAIHSFSVLKLVTTFGGGMVTMDDDDLFEGVRCELARLNVERPRAAGLMRAVTGSIMDIATRPFVFSFGAWPVLRMLRAVKPDIQQRMMTERPQRTAALTPKRVARMHPFQAMLGRRQLSRVERSIGRRGQVCRWLDEALTGIEQVRLLDHNRVGRHNGLYYGILADSAPELSAHLFRRGIDSETSEYLNCADLEIYREYRTACPVAGDIQRRILRLPSYPSLSKRDAGRIALTIREFYERCG